MLKTKEKYLSIVIINLVLFLNMSARGADWPQWRGPNRDGVCTETGLLKSWPEGGPKLLWEISGLGPGYSSMTIINNKLYTMGDIRFGSEMINCILAYDLSTQRRLWEAKVGPSAVNDGPRCMPTFDDGLLYALSTSGDIACVRADDGEVLWARNLESDFGGKNPQWKFSESPLIDGDKVLCTPGAREAVMVALNKKNGELVWKCSMPDIGPKGSDDAGYSSIVISEAGGVRQYVQLTNKGLIGVAAKDGKFLWGYNNIANRVANIPTPIVSGDYVFCSTAYETGSVLLKLVPNNSGVNAEEIYFLDKNTFQNHHGGYVKVGDYIYGGHGHNLGKPICIEFMTGKVMWVVEDQPGGGSAAVLYADGNLYFRYQDNVIALIEANPNEYKLKGQFTLPKRNSMSGQGWPHPVIVDGKLYIRHSDVLLVYDIKAQ